MIKKAALLSLFFCCSLPCADDNDGARNLIYVYSHGFKSTGVNVIHYVKDHYLEKVPALTSSGEIVEIALPATYSNPFWTLYKPVHFFNYPSAPFINVFQNDEEIIITKGVAHPDKVSFAQALEYDALQLPK